MGNQNWRRWHFGHRQRWRNVEQRAVLLVAVVVLARLA
jgi:hypothetical protein